MRQLSVAIKCLCILSLLGSGCKRPLAHSSIQNPPPDEVWLTSLQVQTAQIQVQKIAKQDLTNQIILSGKVAFDDTRLTHVLSPVSGRVTKVLASLGAFVKAGDPLVVIESPDIGIASSDVGKARSNLVAARHELKRQEELLEAHATSSREHEAAEDHFRQAQAEMQRAREKMKLFRHGDMNGVTQTYTLKSEIAGHVMMRFAVPGMEVQGQYGGGAAAELFTIGDLDRVWILAETFESNIAEIQLGAHVEVQVVAYPHRTFMGNIDWIADTLDPVTHTVKIRCTLENPERLLKPEMYATITVYAKPIHMLAIPRSSLLRLGNETVVFTEEGKTEDGRVRFVRTPVSADEEWRGPLLPVSQGVEEGAHVVTSGAILLSGDL